MGVSDMAKHTTATAFTLPATSSPRPVPVLTRTDTTASAPEAGSFYC